MADHRQVVVAVLQERRVELLVPGPGVYSITIQTQWDSVHTGPKSARYPHLLQYRLFIHP